jgi:hypothetical protein
MLLTEVKMRYILDRILESIIHKGKEKDEEQEDLPRLFSMSARGFSNEIIIING